MKLANERSRRAARWTGWTAGFLSAAAAMAQGPVVLNASLREGLVLRYDVEAKLEVRSVAKGDLVDQRMRLRFTVGRADKDGAVVRCRVESARVRIEGSGAEEFVWHEGDGPGGGDESALAHLYRELGGAIIELSLDEHGAVRSVSGLDGAANTGVPPRLLGILMPESAGRMLQGIFTLDPDGRAHGPGQSWSFTQEVPAGVWMTSASTEFTLKGIKDGIASVSGPTTITPIPPTRGEAPIAPRLDISAQSIRTDAQWDTLRGQLVRRVTEGTVDLKSSLPLKEPIEAASTSSSRIVFTRVEPKDPGK